MKITVETIKKTILDFLNQYKETLGYTIKLPEEIDTTAELPLRIPVEITITTNKLSKISEIFGWHGTLFSELDDDDSSLCEVLPIDIVLTVGLLPTYIFTGSEFGGIPGDFIKKVLSLVKKPDPEQERQ